MAGSRVKISHQYGEVYPNVWDDFAWAREHRQELLETYGECYALIYQHQVIGTGKTLEEAVADAERKLPDEVTQVTPIIEYLRYRHPFMRVRPLPSHKENG